MIGTLKRKKDSYFIPKLEIEARENENIIDLNLEFCENEFQNQLGNKSRGNQGILMYINSVVMMIDVLN